MQHGIDRGNSGVDSAVSSLGMGVSTPGQQEVVGASEVESEIRNLLTALRGARHGVARFDDGVPHGELLAADQVAEGDVNHSRCAARGGRYHNHVGGLGREVVIFGVQRPAR